MAVLSEAELVSIRQAMAATQAVNYTKPQCNAAAQSVEDILAANASAISTAINAATAPLVMTAAQKKKLGAEVARVKAERDR